MNFDAIFWLGAALACMGLVLAYLETAENSALAGRMAGYFYIPGLILMVIERVLNG